MGKSLFIAEKPSVAMEFAKALGENMARHDGYQESENIVVTWCVGHLITMSYPEVYDEKLKRWSLSTLPFIPDQFLYEVIPAVKKQFRIVAGLLNREDVETIYVCTDSGREGEYIYRLVAQMAGVKDKSQKRVWIDSQTEEEIMRGIRTAKDLSAYDNLAQSAYLRAKEDYLMGINFSRLLTLKYGKSISSYLGEDRCVISVGRVMTCVLGMIVRREREIRQFVKTPFYRVTADLKIGQENLECEWRAVEGSKWYGSPKLYKENGFLEREDAQELLRQLQEIGADTAKILSAEKKKEKKNPPLLYNLAELQNECSRLFHISPDQTLSVVQELYEKKLVTYPRTDARVLSSAVAKEIDRNLKGLEKLPLASGYVQTILAGDIWKKIGNTRYTNDKQITDHYALIPTGQGLGAIKGLSRLSYGIYMTIVRRFLGIFYPPAEYLKCSLTAQIGDEQFFGSVRILQEPGYLSVMPMKKKDSQKAEEGAEKVPVTVTDQNGSETAGTGTEDNDTVSETEETESNKDLAQALQGIRKGAQVPVDGLNIREGETTPPKRYNSGSMILAMENAGQLIEDEELRAQIRSCGIGTSATRAEILKKLVANRYIALNKKTQILTPTLCGEMIYDVVDQSIRPLLNPHLTASWEKGLAYVAEGSITPEEYMVKMKDFIVRRTEGVLGLNNQSSLLQLYDRASGYYKGSSSGNTVYDKKSSGNINAGKSSGTGRTTGTGKSSGTGRTTGTRKSSGTGRTTGTGKPSGTGKVSRTGRTTGTDRMSGKSTDNL